MSVSFIITKLEELVKQTEQSVSDISDEMEALDPECKDFETLDFELNHTTGMLLGYRHSLTLAMQNGELNLE
jgi:hypothetical protein